LPTIKLLDNDFALSDIVLINVNRGGVEVKILIMKNRNVVLALVGIIVVTCSVGLLCVDNCEKKVSPASQTKNVIVKTDSLVCDI
jgi:hypothetical protein